MAKIDKILISLVLITVFLPVIFTKKHVVHYLTLGDIAYETPRSELFSIPLGLIIILIITMVWRKELKRYSKWLFEE